MDQRFKAAVVSYFDLEAEARDSGYSDDFAFAALAELLNLIVTTDAVGCMLRFDQGFCVGEIRTAEGLFYRKIDRALGFQVHLILKKLCSIPVEKPTFDLYEATFRANLPEEKSFRVLFQTGLSGPRCYVMPVND